MKKNRIVSFLMVSVVALALSSMGAFEAEAAPNNKNDKKIQAQAKKDDKERNDNGNHYGWEIGNGHKDGQSNGNHYGHEHDDYDCDYECEFECSYNCDYECEYECDGEGKHNHDHSHEHEHYRDDEADGGYVNVVYYYENEDGRIVEWEGKEIWAKGLEEGKGNVNSSEFPAVPSGFELKIVGDFYYNGEPELRIGLRPRKG